MSDIDYTLRNKVDHVAGMVVQLDQGLTQVSNQVSQVGQRTEETRDRLQKLAADFETFVMIAQRTANVQRAETRTGIVEAQLENQFGHYKLVRRFATGVLQGFDSGLVSQETVRSVSEQLMVQTPRYWLAPVLVALGAWAEDDRELCDRAIQTGYGRSPSRTSLFLALVLRRQGRREASVRWLRQYLTALDPNTLGRDFAMILECVSQGAFGPAGLELVQERLNSWRAQLLNDDAKQQAQVNRWRGEVDVHVGGSSQASFPRLSAVSPQWPALDRALAHANAHGSLITKYTAMAAEEHPSQDRIEDAVDDILDRLVAEFDDEELPLRREHALNQAIIRNDGDMAASQRDLPNDLVALETRLDYLTIQSESALNPSKIGVSRATQRMAVSSCHDWFGRAHAAFSRDYRLGLPTDVEAVFEGNHTGAGVVFNLPRWTGSFTDPIEHLERSLAEHWDRHGRPFIDSMTFNWRKEAVVPGVVIGAAVLFGLLCAGVSSALALVCVFAALIGGGIWFLVLNGKAQTAAKRQQDARALVERGKQDSIAQLRGAGAELLDWTTAYRDADTREPEVRTLIADLAQLGNAPTPYERRVATGA
ncbi:hypothetical protein MED01_006081 [Micromonospora sp. MED01]|uniref:hypothetical protein n=1 Tax=Micromonospora alfalfae TaxID=2911212 RepID=UPI001EE920EB|nr:hypothetical protein [Micromonospora alfalfae]MCG5467031.1 hypothetical protein [Micromonospora alfalfae]